MHSPHTGHIAAAMLVSEAAAALAAAAGESAAPHADFGSTAAGVDAGPLRGAAEDACRAGPVAVGPCKAADEAGFDGRGSGGAAASRQMRRRASRSSANRGANATHGR
jgi:hypothetical protein